MKISSAVLASLSLLSACGASSTKLVAINTSQPQIPETLLGECQMAAKIPPGATPKQLATVIIHDRAALGQCRRDKDALNRAVRKALH